MEELPNENENKKKQINQNHKLLCELLLDFAKNTTLHGLRYITERGLSAVEKIFWIITFLTSLSVCLWLMGNVWVKWQTSPMIVTLSEKLTSVTEVPFPAVTICPQAKIKQDAYNYTDNILHFMIEMFAAIHRGHNASVTMQKVMQENPHMKTINSLGLICNDNINIEFDSKVTNTDHTAIQDIIKIAPKLDDISYESVWRNQYYLNDTVHTLFDTVLTNEGMCFTFNSLAANEIFDMDCIQSNYSYLTASTPLKGWSLQEGYAFSGNDTYPRRGRANSAEADLMLDLKEVLDRDILCDGYNRGFKVYLHHPADLPQSSLYHYAVPPGQIASFAIKVNQMKTSETLINYTPKIRQCYFPSEKKLRYFKVYTLNNCQLECSTNYTLEKCGCVWFHMPHNDSTDLCKYSRHPCVVDALEEHATDDAMNSSPCQCLPSCDSVQYDAEVVKSDYNLRAFYKINSNVFKEIIETLYKNTSGTADSNHIEEIERRVYARIEMYFKEPRFVSMRRSELFGLTDFLANCGGLLGLFLGFSFLSIVEIFYFFTLRLGCMIRRKNKAKKKKATQYLKNV